MTTPGRTAEERWQLILSQFIKDQEGSVKLPFREPNFKTVILQQIQEAEDAKLTQAAEVAEDFSWILPMYKTACCNNASDDAACEVAEQIALKIQSLQSSPAKEETGEGA